MRQGREVCAVFESLMNEIRANDDSVAISPLAR
jgi:hypothetical protein